MKLRYNFVQSGVKMTEIEALSANLKRFRNISNETQETFAENCGVSTDEVSLLERKLTDPKLSTILSIASYMGISVSDSLS